MVRRDKPTLVYDGQCAFCRAWVGSWEKTTGPAIRYAPLDTVRKDLSPETCAACERSIHLFLPDGSTYRGPHAVFKAWALAGHRRLWLAAYELLPPFRWVADAVYHAISLRRRRLTPPRLR